MSVFTNELEQLYKRRAALNREITSLELKEEETLQASNKELLDRCFKIKESYSNRYWYYKIIGVHNTSNSRFVLCLSFNEEPLIKMEGDDSVCETFDIEEVLVDTLKSRGMEITYEEFEAAVRKMVEEVLYAGEH